MVAGVGGESSRINVNCIVLKIFARKLLQP
jgi:hypothetical protein